MTASVDVQRGKQALADPHNPSHGRFVWYELMTTDMAAAKAFYAKVVGWGTEDASMPGMAYTLFTLETSRWAGRWAARRGAKKPA